VVGRLRQRGFAVLALAVAIVMIAASVVVGWAAMATGAQSNGLVRAQQAYLSEVRARLVEWYERELPTIDRSAAPPDTGRLLREAGIDARWGLRVAVSDRLLRGGVGYRVIAAWLPGEGDASTLEVTDGRFTPSTNTAWVTVSGFELQSRALAQTRARLARTARQLESLYRARLWSDPSRDVTVNRFRAARCDRPLAGEIPCIDDYAPVAAAGLLEAVGLDTLAAANAWGGVVEVSNGVDSSQVMPFSMALRTTTPWGSTVAMRAVAAP